MQTCRCNRETTEHCPLSTVPRPPFDRRHYRIVVALAPRKQHSHLYSHIHHITRCMEASFTCIQPMVFPVTTSESSGVIRRKRSAAETVQRALMYINSEDERFQLSTSRSVRPHSRPWRGVFDFEFRPILINLDLEEARQKERKKERQKERKKDSREVPPIHQTPSHGAHTHTHTHTKTSDERCTYSTQAEERSEWNFRLLLVAS